jgi:thiosulfate/3-mercaptopyruvate sulfurtransferase
MRGRCASKVSLSAPRLALVDLVRDRVGGHGAAGCDRLVDVTDARVLTDVNTLAAALASAEPPTVIDVRWRLGGPPGRRLYEAAHIPSAAFLDLDAELCGRPGAGGRHPRPDPAELQRALRAAGVRAGHPVVAYDGGECQAAARLWWTLRWAGHEAVQVLDGGYAAWVATGHSVEPGSVMPQPGDFAVTPGRMPVLDAAGALLMAREGVLLDARAAARYRGEEEPIDPIAGHIPGAVNLPAAELTGPDGLLRPAEELRARFAELGVASGTPVGAYCGSGVTAAHTVLALAVAGLPEAAGGAALYVGSWSEWVTDPVRTVAIS